MRVERFLCGTAMVLAMALSPAAFAETPSVAVPASPEDTGGGNVVAAASVDSTKLPPVAAIRHQSDIRPYLRPTVPNDVTTAALHRAWSTDPAIRDFIGVNEDVQ